MRNVMMVVFVLPLISGCCSFESCGSCIPRGPKKLLEWSKSDRGNDKNEKSSIDDLSDGKNTVQDDDKKPEIHDPRSEPLKTDRPDFTEASTTVGKGVIQIESGYNYVHDRDGGTSGTTHSYPQALFRVGAFAEWFELRLGQSFSDIQMAGDINNRVSGNEDTYLGIKLALTEQKNILPETGLILQTTIPTGQKDLSANRMLPGISFLFGWDLIKDKIDCGGSLLANKAINDDQNSYIEIAQSFTIGYTLTEKLGAFTEWYAIYPSGAVLPDIGPQYYFDGGFTYRFTKDIQFDINAGVGLNRRSDDYFIGTGLALRF